MRVKTQRDNVSLTTTTMLLLAPSYVFQDLTKDKSNLAKQLMAEYEHKPHFLRHDHGLQFDLGTLSHQFFVGAPGAG